MEEISLVDFENLPEKVTAPTPGTLCIMITYKRVVERHKNLAVYGGAMASYPKEKDFKLDRETLLPSL